MDLDTTKVKLIDWIAQTNDQKAIDKLLYFKQ